jgi:hypothetical protein
VHRKAPESQCLAPVKKVLQTLPRHTLTQYMTESPAFATFVATLLPVAIKKKTFHRALIAFWTASLLSYISRKDFVTQEELGLILPGVYDAIRQKGVAELQVRSHLYDARADPAAAVWLHCSGPAHVKNCLRSRSFAVSHRDGSFETFDGAERPGPARERRGGHYDRGFHLPTPGAAVGHRAGLCRGVTAKKVRPASLSSAPLIAAQQPDGHARDTGKFARH